MVTEAAPKQPPAAGFPRNPESRKRLSGAAWAAPTKPAHGGRSSPAGRQPVIMSPAEAGPEHMRGKMGSRTADHI